MKKCVPDVFDYETLLYIGASASRAELLSEFEVAGYKIIILEAWKANVSALAEKGLNVVHGDVRQIDKHIKTKFDIVFWWHGPEHVNVFEAGYVLGRLQSHAKHLVVASSPWGKYPQGAIDGNPYERHLCELYIDDYISMGWKVDAIGEEDVKGSNLMGWRRI